MTKRSRLLLSYFLSLVFLVGSIAGFALRRFSIGILFYLLLMLARWGINPVCKAYKNVWRSRLGKISVLLFCMGVFGVVFFVFVLNYSNINLPEWLLKFWLYGFILPVVVVEIIMTVKEEIKAANVADKSVSICKQGD